MTAEPMTLADEDAAVTVAAVRSLPDALAATPEAVVTAGEFRLVGSPIHIDGYEPDYRPPPSLDEHIDEHTDVTTQSS